MKNFFAILLVATLLLQAYPAVAKAAAEDPTLSVSQETAAPGETVTVDISLASNPGLVTMQLQVEYDESVLTLTEVQDKGQLGSAMHNPTLTSPYILRWANNTAAEDITANGTVVTLVFEVAADAPAGEYPISVSYDYDNYDIINWDMDSVWFAVANGAVTVNQPKSDVTDISAFKYTLSGTEMTITSYIGDDPDVVLGSTYTIDGVEYTVTATGIGAFSGIDHLNSVIIPDSITSMAGSAFAGSKNLTRVVLGKGIQTIPGCGFLACSSLTEIVIPENVIHIGVNAFNSCDSLAGFLVDENNPNFSTDSRGVLFNKDKTTLIFAPGGIAGSYIVPDSVTTIEAEAFCGCDSLQDVSIPDSVTTIGYGAFAVCNSLTGFWVDDNNPNYCSDDYGVLFNKEKTTLLQAPGGITGAYTIPESVTAIDPRAFYYCTSLMSVTLDDSISSIEWGAFDECVSLQDVYYAGSEAQWAQVSIGSSNSCLISATIHYNYSNCQHDYTADPAVCGTCGHVRVSSEVTSVVLKPTVAGIYFKGTFAADADLQIARQGIVVSTSNALPVADDSDPSSLYTTSGVSVLVKDILKTDNTDAQNRKNALAPIYARTYILLEDGTYIYGDVVTVNLRQVVEGIDDKFDALNSTQKNAITAMYETYAKVMQFFAIPNIKEYRA